MDTHDAAIREAFIAKARAEADEQIAFNKMVEKDGSPESRHRWQRARDRRNAIVERYADQLAVASG